ncbi:MAG: hypothetical protein ACP5NY_00870 [Thermocladium sp.]
MVWLLVKLHLPKANLINLVNIMSRDSVLLQIIRRGSVALIEMEGRVGDESLNEAMKLPEVELIRPVPLMDMDIITLIKKNLIASFTRRINDLYSRYSLFRFGFDYAASILSDASLINGGHYVISLIMDMANAMGYFNDYNATPDYSRIQVTDPFDSDANSQFLLGFINGILNYSLGKSFAVDVRKVSDNKFLFSSIEISSNNPH